MATLHLCDGWRLSEDGRLQWILQRERPKANDERDRCRLRRLKIAPGLLRPGRPRRAADARGGVRGWRPSPSPSECLHQPAEGGT